MLRSSMVAAAALDRNPQPGHPASQVGWVMTHPTPLPPQFALARSNVGRATRAERMARSTRPTLLILAGCLPHKLRVGDSPYVTQINQEELYQALLSQTEGIQG